MKKKIFFNFQNIQRLPCKKAAKENLIGKKVMTSFYSGKFVANKCLAILHRNIVMLILSDLSITALLLQVTKTE